MSLETPAQNNNPIEILNSLSIEQRSKIDQLHNKTGLPPIENMIDVYLEDNPNDQKLATLLRELKMRLPETEDFRTKLGEMLNLIN